MYLDSLINSNGLTTGAVNGNIRNWVGDLVKKINLFFKILMSVLETNIHIRYPKENQP